MGEFREFWNDLSPLERVFLAFMGTVLVLMVILLVFAMVMVFVSLL